ncbi:hypothetical protein [Sporosarcina sp. SAFN-015]|uniref:hypothetical protein n=1 Tax=Sporosarcina sp. SAFN-015 TaxID=3387274 RepID=UPI003F7DAB1A
MVKNPWFKKTVFAALIGSIIVAVFLVLKPSSQSVEHVQAEKNNNFTSDVILVDDFAFQITNSSHSKSEQTFYFSVENIANTEVSTNSISFTIKNEGNVYSSWSVDIADSRLNPGMSTTATVTFKMLDAYLMDGQPVMEIQRGVFFPVIKQFELVKES